MSTQFVRRRQKLIKPKLQLRLTGAFAGVAILAMLLQFLVLGHLMVRAATQIDGVGGQLADQVPGLLLIVLVVSLLILLPLFTLVGIFLTFRFAGPVYRFEQYFEGIARGEELRPCSIRDNDELQTLCRKINLAMSRLQTRRGAEPDEDLEDRDQRLSA